MTKEVLIHQIIDVLARAGFALSDRCNIRPRSFDVAARKDETLLLCKVLFNIDGLNEETAREMKYLAEYLGGSAIVVGAKTRDQMLEDSVVYMRYDILALNVQTLYDYFIENVPPLVSAAPGGLYVSIEGDILKKARTGQSMSLGTLASMHVIAGKAVAFKEAMSEKFKQDQVQTVKNAKTLCKCLKEKGFDMVSGDTDNHLMLVNLNNMNITGKDAEAALSKAGIIANKNTVPFETRSPFITSGVRLGTPACTTRGMKETEMELIADYIETAITNSENDKILSETSDKVRELCSRFPVYC
jgi:Glycine/serine hydroxymethyltransferase